MGTTTPNIGIYAPAAGETNYSQSFAAGMVNIDQHDHSGGPNKGLPIATEGLGDFSVTFDKLNANVVDPTTGVGNSGTFPNQIVLLDPIKSIFQLAPASGFITMDGTTSHVRTFQNSSSITWTNADGVGGNPSASVNIAGISPVTVPNGGTGLTTLTPYAVLAGGTTNTGNVQQVSGLGNVGEVLTSQGAGALPIWAASSIQYQKITLTAAQFTNLGATPITLVPAPGAGKVLVPLYCYTYLASSGVPFTSATAAIGIYYNNTEQALLFNQTMFNGSTTNLYNWATPSQTQLVSVGGFAEADIVNKPLQISTNNGGNYAGGGTSTVTFMIAYTTITLP